MSGECRARVLSRGRWARVDERPEATMRVLEIGRGGAGQSAGAAVTIGVYDGLHRGHLWTLRKLRQVAAARGLETALVTFDPHPLAVLRPVSAPKLLTDLRQRLELAARTGLVDVCAVVPFDLERSRQSPADFVREVLLDTLRAREIVVGEGFRFGCGRSGDVAALEELGRAHGYTVTAVPLLPARTGYADTPCSSTAIRGLVTAGEVEAAARLLGRPHAVRGRIVGTSWPSPGRGVPTVVARVPAAVCLPAEGTYAGSVVGPDRRERQAAVSVRRGVVDRHGVHLDIHLTDRVRELMDAEVVVRLHRRLWASGKHEAYAEVQRASRDIESARAAGGWGAAV